MQKYSLLVFKNNLLLSNMWEDSRAEIYLGTGSYSSKENKDI